MDETPTPDAKGKNSVAAEGGKVWSPDSNPKTTPTLSRRERGYINMICFIYDHPSCIPLVAAAAIIFLIGFVVIGYLTMPANNNEQASNNSGMQQYGQQEVNYNGVALL